ACAATDQPDLGPGASPAAQRAAEQESCGGAARDSEAHRGSADRARPRDGERVIQVTGRAKVDGLLRGEEAVRLQLVAGAGFEPATFGLRLVLARRHSTILIQARLVLDARL